MNWLNTIYLGCFIFGLIFTVSSFLLGGMHQFHIGGPIHLHTGHGHTGHGHNVSNGSSDSKEVLGWFNLNALVVFLTWFGGAGFILGTIGFGAWLSLILAIVVGVVGYVAVLLFLTKFLVGSQTPVMQISDYELTGTIATVSSTIFENGTGEVIFSKHGTRRAVAARSVDGKPFSRESQVVILRFEAGIAFVEDVDRLLFEAGAAKWSIDAFEAKMANENKPYDKI